jgi:hypothetical protein
MHSFQKADIYFSAHQDDWQLFMDPEVGRSMANKYCRSVIIHITAGDAGRDEKYWKAREQAAIESILFRLSTAPHIHHPEHTKAIVDCDRYGFFGIGNCSCYFLRLPDGSYTGNGFDKYDQQSLHKLRTGAIPTIASVDGKALYHNWNHLVQTIDHIIETELNSCQIESPKDVTLNIPEFDRALNPWDHNDHYNTSLLVQDTKACQRYRTRSFLTYHLKNSSDLLTGEELFWKIGMFCAYQHFLLRETGHSTLTEDAAFIPWCLRNTSYRDLNASVI